MRCEKDDLAYIKSALRQANVGLAVECKEYLGYYLKDDIVEVYGEHFRAIISDNYWLIENGYGEIETQFGKSKVAYHPDTWLEPVKKKKLEDKVTTDEGLDLHA